MTSEIIGIESDQSQQVIDAVERALNDKGVLLTGELTPTVGSGMRHLIFKGMGNGRWSIYHLPSLKDLSNEQIQEKASEIVKEVEQKLRSGGDE